MAFSRRSFLTRGSLLATGTIAMPSWMPRMVFRDEQTDPSGDILVVIFARGGYDGLNMVVPYGDEGDYFRLRPTIAIPAPDSTATDRALYLDDFFGLHPALGASNAGRWKELFDEGILGIAHAVHMADPTRSHFDAMDFMERGTPGKKALNSGWLGRHLSSMRTQNNSPFRAVGMGTMLQSSLRGPVPAVTLQSITDFHLQGRQDEVARFQAQLQQLYGGEGWLDTQGNQTFEALALLEQAIGSGAYVPSNGAVYTDNDGFHMGMRQIAQLVKADVGLEVACIDIGGWDTHANQTIAGAPTTGNMANLMRRLATGVTAFVDDLRDYFDPRERDKQGVTVVIMSEFGRRAFENGTTGTDHGHGNAMFVVGRGINGGRVYTNPWPGLADDRLDRGDLAGTTEYRDILAEILVKRVGNEAIGQVFPGHTINYLGLAVPVGTAAPTPPPAEPTAVPTDPPGTATSTIYLPYGNRP